MYWQPTLPAPQRDDALLLAYAEQLGNKTVYKRLGYLVEAVGIDAPALLAACQERMSSGYSLLDPSSPPKGIAAAALEPPNQCHAAHRPGSRKTSRMISRAQLNELAQEWGLSERVVEKDYVIGWLLWGIGTEPALRQAWAFKGGTCLKKCYIETYRFSEDLDFTILPAGPFLPEAVAPLFTRILDRVQQASGIDFASRQPVFKQRGTWPAAEGRIYYRGPRQTPGVESIKLDLLANETVVRPTVLRSVAHPYADTLPAPDTVRCYSFEEVFAEKIRALGERSRSRDLYDVVNLYRRRDLHIYPAVIAAALSDKCASKGIPVPTFGAIADSPAHAEFAAEWRNMLEHQLPALPPFDHYWQELSNVFAWLEDQQVLAPLPAFPVSSDVDASLAPTGNHLVVGCGQPTGKHSLCSSQPSVC